MTTGYGDNVGSGTRTSPKVVGAVQTWLQELAEPRPGGDRTKAAIDRAARKAGLTYWRTFDLWYGKARRIEQFELDAIADALERKRIEADRHAISEIRTRLALVEARLNQTDAEFYRPTIDFMREENGGLGGPSFSKPRRA